MRSLKLNSLFGWQQLAAFGLVTAVWAATGAAGESRGHHSSERHGQRASSTSMQSGGGGSSPAFRSYAAPFTPAAQNNNQPESFATPGAQNTPQFRSFATPGVQNTPQHRSFATPGTQNQDFGGWGQSTAWSQPSRPATNPWSSGAWSGSTVTPRPQPQPQRFAQAESQTWSPPAPQVTYRPTSPLPANTFTRPVTPQRSTLSYGGGAIRILVPAWESRPCNYVLQDASQAYTYSMQPGKSQTFSQDRDWSISFDRGSGYGAQSYRLQPGQYEFRRTSQGWQLYRTRAVVTGALAFAN